MQSDANSNHAAIETLSHAERALLSRLRNAINQCIEFDISLEQFEKRLAGIALAKWQQMYARVAPATRTSADLCCLLAYRGVNYAENLAELFQPYYRYSAAPHADTQEAHNDSFQLKHVPGYLALLYRRNRDDALLEAMLDMQVAVPAAFDAYIGTMAALWDEDSQALLVCASTSQGRILNLAAILTHVCRLMADAQIWQTYQRRLQQAIQESEPAIAQAARQVERLLNDACPM